DPSRRDLRRDDAHHRVDLGEVPLGSLVAVEREAARALPRPVPLLLGVLHAALLGRAGAAPGEPVGGVLAVRRRADPDQLPRDQAGERVHPSGRVHEPRAADVRLTVLHVLRLPRGDALGLLGALSARARGQADRREPPRAAGALVLTTEEKY